MANKREKLSSDWRTWPIEVKVRLLQRLNDEKGVRLKRRAVLYGESSQPRVRVATKVN